MMYVDFFGGMSTFIFVGMPTPLLVVAFTVTVLKIGVVTLLRETLSETDV